MDDLNVVRIRHEITASANPCRTMTPSVQEHALAQATHGNRRMMALQIIKLTCKLASVLVLARLVPPGDHGLFAMASSVVLFLSLFRDAGLGTAAIQAPDLTAVQLSTLFWDHVSIGIVLTAITCVVAPSAALFYGSPAVIPLLFVMSASFLLIGAGGFARTQLERSARFSDVSRIEGVAAIVGTLLMILAAWSGAGAYSFAVYLLVSEAVATALAWHAFQWRPTGRPEWSSVRDLLRLGADVTTYQTLTYFLQQVDGIVVGRLFGAHWLGLYNRSNQLLSLPSLYIAAPLNQVGLVTLSRLRAESGQVTRHAASTVTVIAHLVLPLFAICCVLPTETVRLVLGPQWPEAAPLLRVLSIAAAAMTITSLGNTLAVAQGQTRRLVVAAAISLPMTLGAVWLGSRDGPIGVARSVSVVTMILLLPRLWWVLRELPHGFASYVRALLGPLLSTLIAAAGMFVCSHWMAETSWLTRLISSVAAGFLGAALLTLVWPALRAEWRSVAELLPFSFSPGREAARR